MFAGHIGAALALGRVERRVNVGLLVAAALLMDFLLWLFVLLGWESLTIPAAFATTHQPEFVFPYSHGLVAGIVWSALAAAGAWAFHADVGSLRARAAFLVAAAVFSHWLLDALVHRPEMPLLGASSHMVGLGLWGRMPAALAIEAALVVLGAALFIAGSGLSRGRSTALAVSSLAILAATVFGMTLAPAPPSARAMAGTSLGTLGVVCMLFAWLGRRSRDGRV